MLAAYVAVGGRLVELVAVLDADRLDRDPVFGGDRCVEPLQEGALGGAVGLVGDLQVGAEVTAGDGAGLRSAGDEHDHDDDRGQDCTGPADQPAAIAPAAAAALELEVIAATRRRGRDTVLYVG